ncbi:type VI secretion system lipoprotein TssJ [Luteimonas sp. MJ250]|uniref:type VI secretion system lipoprotein TssJ n=1 Tax=Luteimonas sp. MJ250 TaxID=3129236 RepID=UPI0031BBC8E7
MAAAGLLGLAGCASKPTREDAPGLMSRALETVGLRKQSEEPAAPRAKSIPLRLWAGANLNSGNDQKPLAVVVKVYRLRDTQRFERAPFSAFLDEDAERDALGDDLISSTEIVLQPNQRHEITERLPPEAAAMGVVALFRSPAPDRWRFSFDALEAEKDGVTVGLHACALTTSSSGLQSQIAGESHSLTLTRCSKG